MSIPGQPSRGRSAKLFLLDPNNTEPITDADPLVAYFPLELSSNDNNTTDDDSRNLNEGDSATADSQEDINRAERQRDKAFGKFIKSSLESGSGRAVVIKEYWGSRIITYRWDGTVCSEPDSIGDFVAPGELPVCLEALRGEDSETNQDGEIPYNGPVKREVVELQYLTYRWKPKHDESGKSHIAKQCMSGGAVTVDHGKSTCGSFCPGRPEGEEEPSSMPSDPNFCVTAIDHLPRWMIKVQAELAGRGITEDRSYTNPGDGSCYFSIPVMPATDTDKDGKWNSF